jgi:hypothetical protein
MRILGLIAFTFQGKLRDLLSISSNHLGIALGDWHPGHIPNLPSAENQAFGSKSIRFFQICPFFATKLAPKKLDPAVLPPKFSLLSPSNSLHLQ